MLGAALAVGYFCKSIMFPMAFVFLGVSILRDWSRANAARILVAAAVFVVIAGPWVTLLSRAKGHVTFAESGGLAFAWSNYNIPVFHYQGSTKGGKVLHPTRQIYADPPVFEFDGPIRASYPPWYDPSYWNAGLAPRFDFFVVARHVLKNITAELKIYFRPVAWVTGMVLLLACCRPNLTLAALRSYWYLLIPVLAVSGAYALTFSEFRYFPGWSIVLWGAVIASLRMRNHLGHSFALNGAMVLVVLAMVSAVAYGAYGQAVHGNQYDGSSEYLTAEGLLKLGLHRGDKVASIGFDVDAHWAYLAGLNIVADIPTTGACEFWQAPETVRADILERLAGHGVRAVVANGGGGMQSSLRGNNIASCTRPDSNWQKLAGVANYARFLTK